MTLLAVLLVVSPLLHHQFKVQRRANEIRVELQTFNAANAAGTMSPTQYAAARDMYANRQWWSNRSSIVERVLVAVHAPCPLPRGGTPGLSSPCRDTLPRWLTVSGHRGFFYAVREARSRHRREILRRVQDQTTLIIIQDFHGARLTRASNRQQCANDLFECRVWWIGPGVPPQWYSPRRPPRQNLLQPEASAIRRP